MKEQTSYAFLFKWSFKRKTALALWTMNSLFHQSKCLGLNSLSFKRVMIVLRLLLFDRLFLSSPSQDSQYNEKGRMPGQSLSHTDRWLQEISETKGSKVL